MTWSQILHLQAKLVISLKVIKYIPTTLPPPPLLKIYPRAHISMAQKSSIDASHLIYSCQPLFLYAYCVNLWMHLNYAAYTVMVQTIN